MPDISPKPNGPDRTYRPDVQSHGSDDLLDFHLTARPWSPLRLPPERYLRNVETAFRSIMKYQDDSGAIIDPVKGREFQYATAYFAFAGATLTEFHHDLIVPTIKAMDHTIDQIGRCNENGPLGVIPDNHGNFFLAPLAGAYMILKSQVEAAKAEKWRRNLATPLEKVVRPATNNWRTYAMKGEWLRAEAGVIPVATAQAYAESSWPSQLSRIGSDNLRLYHDARVDPETYAYDLVARMNIEVMLQRGYSGAATETMTAFVTKGGEAVVKMLDPTGQSATNGRTGDHSWNDVVAGNLFELLANRYSAQNDTERAGRYRRASAQVLRGTDRWLRNDGSYSVTKNQFQLPLQVHYANYSSHTQYNGSMMYHQAESYRERRLQIDECPTWNEIGGYAIETDNAFAGVFVNAGGMHMQIALRGQLKTAFGVYWTAMGVSRFSRVDWDSRLGPSGATRHETSHLGISFAPTYRQGTAWVRLASIPHLYRAHFRSSFVHPLLIKFNLQYRSIFNHGPLFDQDFTVTPDGVLTTLRSALPEGQWGVTLPLLVDDGEGALIAQLRDNIASTRFLSGTDEQNYIALARHSAVLSPDGPAVRGAYGDIQGIRYLTTGGAVNRTFIYPRSADAPPAAAVRDSLVVTADGFKSILGSVNGCVYVGETSAGGEGDSLEIGNGGRKTEIRFDRRCRFIVQLNKGRGIAIEADRAVRFTWERMQNIPLEPYVPIRL